MVGCFLPPLFLQNPTAGRKWHTFKAGGIPLRGACGSLEWGGREVDGINEAVAGHIDILGCACVCISVCA